MRPSRALLLVLLVCAFTAALASDVHAQVLRIYNIDVEQADAALLVMPNGKTLLIDSGKNGHGQRLKKAMDRAGVSKIDVFVASHYHEDHYGGIDELVDLGVPVLEAYDRGDKQFVPASTKTQKTYKDYQRTVGEDARPLRRGDTIVLDPLVTITCLGSGGVVIGESTPIPADEENDMSISLLISFAGFRAYFGGDTEQPTEEKQLEHHLAKAVDFYKSSHHGSHSSSWAPFMVEMQPSVIVISNGSATHKHPRAVTLATYAGLSVPPLVVQTNKCFRTAPCANVADQFIADPETNDDDGIVETRVDATVHTFTVMWRSESRTIPIRAPAPTDNAPSSASILIVSLTPNPVGSDEQNETVTIRNNGVTAVSLEGWLLRDRSGLVWGLSGALAPGQSKTIKRSGQPMSLNNAGDDISLVDASQVVRDTFTYTASGEGVAIPRP